MEWTGVGVRNELKAEQVDRKILTRYISDTISAWIAVGGGVGKQSKNIIKRYIGTIQT